jgi:hypothetical protein
MTSSKRPLVVSLTRLLTIWVGAIPLTLADARVRVKELAAPLAPLSTASLHVRRSHRVSVTPSRNNSRFFAAGVGDYPAIAAADNGGQWGTKPPLPWDTFAALNTLRDHIRQSVTIGTMLPALIT